MKRLIIVFFVFGLLGSSFGQKDPVIMTVKGKPVYKSEFEQIYWKNKKEDVATKEDLDEYMELFTKFKLKVAEAEELGLDTNAKFVQELAGYKAQLEKPYLVDKEVNEKLIQEAYFRTKNEIRASHILIKLNPNPSPSDTVRAYNKIMDIRSKIAKGDLDFNDAAKKFSEDPSAKRNNGDLGYFTAFRMVYAFESAAFNTKVGEVSMPFRTRFGYHLVFPSDLRDGRGKIKVAHIMLRVKEDASDQQKQNLEKKINEIYQQLEKGADFNKLAKQYSEDRKSAPRGGELNWIKPGETFMEFENAAFGLKNDGDYSKPTLTGAGWHIIKRVNYKPVGDLESMRTELKNRIQRDSRSQISKELFMKKLKTEYGYKEKYKSFKKVVAAVDSTIFKGMWKPDSKESQMKKPLFQFADQKFTQQDLIQFMANNQTKREAMDLESYVRQRFDRFISNSLITYEKTQLQTKYPEFKALLKEYRDGILLFEITDQKVWSKGIKDTVGLQAYYEAHKNEYMWPDRVEARIFSSTKREVINEAFDLVNKGELQMDSIINYLNRDSQLNITFEEGVFIDESKEIIKDFDWKMGVNKPRVIDGKHCFVVIDKNVPSAPKELKEAKGVVTAAYQDQLESDWLKELEAKYPVTIDKEVLYTIKNKP